MSSHLQRRIDALNNPKSLEILAGINRGIEKESLRMSPDGKLAQTPHPTSLGSALSHASVTTDYSEALLEFITAPNTSIEQSLENLADVHRFVYQNLDQEILWSASMPCLVTGDEGIPVAEYGSSNVARMKTVYRLGLGHRYGRLMQAISGIHYNFSMPDEFWQQAWQEAGQPGTLTDYISGRYLDMIRNFHRNSWLLIYLYGASPAVCASFLRGQTNHNLQPFDDKSRSLYLPYGTALRMGNLGYNSDAQEGLKVCYNCLDEYVETLSSAILKPHPGYAGYSSGHNGEYQQLNGSLLQIENEFYSPIRPKRVARSGETPLGALRRGGIEYIEVRCVDVNPFTPVGLDAEQIRFMDLFLLHCLLQESPPCDDQEQDNQRANLEAVVNLGRQPGLRLNNGSENPTLTEWANDLLTSMEDIGALMDAASTSSNYSAALTSQFAKVADPELTPSARILREMRQQNLPFFRLVMKYSEQWAEQFRSQTLAPDVKQRFAQEVQRSKEAQQAIEAADSMSFEDYLSGFYAQYQKL